MSWIGHLARYFSARSAARSRPLPPRVDAGGRRPDQAASSPTEPEPDRPADAPDLADIPATLKQCGPYRVLSLLGSGGMGQVYKAEDTRLQRLVALKFLPADAAHDQQALDRFRIEARAASALNHPNICTVYDLGDCDAGTFIAMEFLDGESLRDHLRRRAMRPARLLALGIQIADGLAAAHAKGIVHRDIKPANLFVVDGERIKILDFGVAKLHAARSVSEISTHTATASLTIPGSAVGTLPYMSPEQARGEDIDRRSDLFALAAVLYEMASRRRAFPGSTPADVFAVMLGVSPVLPDSIEPRFRCALQAIIDKGLEKDREFRYQHAADVAADLRRLQRDLAADRLPLPGVPRAGALPPPPLPTRVAADFARAALVAALAFLGHGFVDRSAAGKYLDQFQVAFIHEGLFDQKDFQAGGRHLPLVVDLSRLHPDKQQPTSRKVLDVVIEELRKARATAIGVDLSFDDIEPTDFQYFKRWRDYGNVRIGIYRRAPERREAWLGRSEFAALAAGIAMPADNPQYAYAYSRRWATKPTRRDEGVAPDCASAAEGVNCKEDLYELPVALWLIAERGAAASEGPLSTENPETRVTRVAARQAGLSQRALPDVLELGSYAIDYSYLHELRRDVITLTPGGTDPLAYIAGQLRARPSAIADRLVLVGDLEDTTDHLCYTPGLKPVAGVLVHGCALATWNRAMLLEPRTTMGQRSWAALTLLLIGTIVVLRVAHDRSRFLRHIPYQHAELFVFGCLAIGTVMAARWLSRAEGIVWPNFIWFAGALAVYSFSGPFSRAIVAVPRIVRTALAEARGDAQGG